MVMTTMTIMTPVVSSTLTSPGQRSSAPNRDLHKSRRHPSSSPSLFLDIGVNVPMADSLFIPCFDDDDDDDDDNIDDDNENQYNHNEEDRDRRSVRLAPRIQTNMGQVY